MRKVLVVDDDKLVRKGLIAAMPWEKHGLAVVGEAGNGELALDFIRRNPIDLLVTDLAMPIMSGIELMRTVHKEFPHIGVVVLTFHQDFELIQEALRLGAIDYIAKVQLEVEQMDDVLARIMARIRQGEEHRVYPRHSSAPQLSELVERWTSLEWVVHDRIFADLLQTLLEAQYPAHTLESLFFTARHEWMRIVPEVQSVPVAGADSSNFRENWQAFIHAARQIMRAKLHKPAHSAEISISIIQVIRYIHNNLGLEMRVKDVAKQANMSLSYFSQCFKEIVGLTFSDYLKELRITHAQALLVQTTNPIYWVAEKCGYPDDKYFSRVFREKVGVLPSKFREIKAKGEN